MGLRRSVHAVIWPDDDSGYVAECGDLRLAGASLQIHLRDLRYVPPSARVTPRQRRQPPATPGSCS